MTFKKIMRVFGLQLQPRKKTVIIWGVALCGAMLIYLAMFPLIKMLFTEQFGGVIPDEFMDMMQELTDPNLYFASLWEMMFLAFMVYAVFTGASIFSNEESSGSSEFLYSLPIERGQVWLGKVLFNLCSLFVLVFCTGLVSLVTLVIVGEGLCYSGIVLCFVFTFLSGMIFSLIGSMLSNVMRRQKSAAPIAIGVFFGLYLLGFLSGIGIEALGFLKYLCPALFLNPTLVMSSSLGIGTEPFSFVAYILIPVFLAVPAAVGFFRYRKKDVA